jgi:hypothetical protein
MKIEIDKNALFARASAAIPYYEGKIADIRERMFQKAQGVMTGVFKKTRRFTDAEITTALDTNEPIPEGLYYYRREARWCWARESLNNCEEFIKVANDIDVLSIKLTPREYAILEIDE